VVGIGIVGWWWQAAAAAAVWVSVLGGAAAAGPRGLACVSGKKIYSQQGRPASEAAAAVCGERRRVL